MMDGWLKDWIQTNETYYKGIGRDYSVMLDHIESMEENDDD
jgi:hypothetical protein